MKVIKYLFVGALMTGFSAHAMAQDIKSQIEAISKVIVANKANPDAVKDQVKDFYKENKKNAEALVGLGRAYLNIEDTLSATKYADEAIKREKSNGAGYILKGDIEAFRGDGGAAAGWYQQAVYFDPQNPTGYIKYANIYRVSSPEEAVSMLEKLRAIKPDYPVDAVSGHYYYLANDFDKAIASFDKAGMDKLDESQLTEYALSAYFRQNFDKTISVSTFGLQKHPRLAGLNRLAFYGYTDKKDYDNALTYADRLFNQSDSAKFTALDYTYHGYAYNGKKDYDNAINSFKKALELNQSRPEVAAGVMKQLSDAYLAKGDYENALAQYENYLKNTASPTANDYVGLASIYRNRAVETTGEEQIAALKKADEVYKSLGEKFEDAQEYSLFMRARMNVQIDPETKDGLAKPFYEQLATLIEGHTGELTAADRARIIESYHYLISYHFMKDEVEPAKAYSQKLLKVDPEDAVAKQVLGL